MGRVPASVGMSQVINSKTWSNNDVILNVNSGCIDAGKCWTMGSCGDVATAVVAVEEDDVPMSVAV
jgi:hypothetical protein